MISEVFPVGQPLQGAPVAANGFRKRAAAEHGNILHIVATVLEAKMSDRSRIVGASLGRRWKKSLAPVT